MKNRKYLLSAICYLLFISFWLFTIRQAVLGQLGGTFARRTVPAEYVALRDFFMRQPEFFRTLWVPRQSRFSYVSDLHPAVEAGPLFSATDAATLRQVMQRDTTKELVENLSIRYVLIPSDVYGEIFQEDRRHSPPLRASYTEVLDGISWLEKVQEGPLTVYETATHF